MSSISPQELTVIGSCIHKIAKHRTIIAACIYGSKVAGYGRPDSDIDLLVVLENYPYVVKYIYFRESGTKVSALVVDRNALLRDAKSGFLGEFVIGRLLHIYEPIVNSGFLALAEQTYKRRVILEEVASILESTGILGTELIFPLEFIVFSKIKRRMSLYASAAYSYYKIYTTTKRNLEFALDGYHRAMSDIITENDKIFVSRQDGLLQISDQLAFLENRQKFPKLSKRLSEISSYLVHTYAGRKIMHFAINEAESKIRRRVHLMMKVPDFMQCPKKVYWMLPEGKLILNGPDWLESLAQHLGSYSVSRKVRLGSGRSRTTIYELKHGSCEYKIAVKEFAKLKVPTRAKTFPGVTPRKRFSMDPLSRLGLEYKAIRYIRSLGLSTPAIEAVVVDKKLLVTRFVDGVTLADVIRDCVEGKGGATLIREAGAQISKIHRAGATLGDVKLKTIIVRENKLFFTDLEHLVFRAGDPAMDLAQFISLGLGNTSNVYMAATITKEFVEGYVRVDDPCSRSRVAKSRNYIESFYPKLIPSIASTIKNEIKNIAG